jgi:hypothetical protein
MSMTMIKLLVLFLALSVSLNIGFTAGTVARVAGQSLPRSVLVGAGAAATFLTIFFTALPSYQAGLA